jgi:hypothetical protein
VNTEASLVKKAKGLGGEAGSGRNSLRLRKNFPPHFSPNFLNNGLARIFGDSLRDTGDSLLCGVVEIGS